MASPKTRTGTCKFSDSVDVEQADEFIRRWEKLSIYIGLKEGFSRRICQDRHSFISGALEGAYKTYIVLSKMKPPPWDEKLVKNILRRSIKRSIRDMAMINGYIPTRGQIFFPRQWLAWDDYFSLCTKQCDTIRECELRFIHVLIETLPEKDAEIMRLFESGYDCAYISRVVGFRSRSAGLKRVYKSLAAIRSLLHI